MKTLSVSARYESSTGDILLVEVSKKTIYLETWSNGFKQYKNLTGVDRVDHKQLLEALIDMQLVDFDMVEIENFIHYSGCFYED
ncbi:hypothetical protein ACX818_001341 [Acinetobacter baumannii]